jgi:hypothetical protein
MSYYSRVERVARPHARPQALDRVILRVPEPEPHDVQHVGGGLPRCSAASAASRPLALLVLPRGVVVGDGARLDGLVRALTGVRRRAKRGAAACVGRRDEAEVIVLNRSHGRDDVLVILDAHEPQAHAAARADLDLLVVSYPLRAGRAS